MYLAITYNYIHNKIYISRKAKIIYSLEWPFRRLPRSHHRFFAMRHKARTEKTLLRNWK